MSLCNSQEELVSANPFSGLIDPKIVNLPVGAKLFHGAQDSWSPVETPPIGRFWFAQNWDGAYPYAVCAPEECGEPVIHEFTVIRSLRLLDLSDGEAAALCRDEDRLFDPFKDSALVVAAGYDGWLWPEDDNLMVGDASAVAYVCTHKAV